VAEEGSDVRRHRSTPLAARPDCHDVAEVLQSFLDGQLDHRDHELVAEHLRHCERCGIEAATVRRVIDAIRRQRAALPPGQLDDLTRWVDDLAAEGHPD
jgi:anti-sigma factor RsiW